MDKAIYIVCASTTVVKHGMGYHMQCDTKYLSVDEIRMKHKHHSVHRDIDPPFVLFKCMYII